MLRGKQPLSYRHLFHAGNHGDVLKHSVLSMLVCMRQNSTNSNMIPLSLQLLHIFDVHISYQHPSRRSVHPSETTNQARSMLIRTLDPVELTI